MRIGGNDGNEVIGERCEPGVHPSVLAAVYDIGTHRVLWEGKEKLQHKVVLWWEIDARDTQGRRFTIPQVLTASSSEKANMTKVYGALAGRGASEKEMAEGFDMDPMIGVTCLVQVDPPKEGKKWPYITNVMPLPKSMPRLTVECDVGGEDPKFITMMRDKAVKPGEKAATAKPSTAKVAVPSQPASDGDSEIPF